MKRLAALVVALAAFVAATLAFADRSDAVLSSTVDWRALSVFKVPLSDGGTQLTASVCGTAYLSDGTESAADKQCVDITLTGAQQTSITTFMNSALTAWKTRRGL